MNQSNELRSFERVSTHFESEKILKIHEVITITNLSKATIYRLAADPNSSFPKPVKLSTRASGWKLSALTQWVNNL